MKADKKVVLVTGGGAGIGEAVCYRLAKDQMAVGVADICLEDAEKVAARIRENGGDAIAIRADVSDEAEVDAMFDTLLEQYGKINCLAANAGIFRYGDFLQFSFQDWKSIMRVNVDGLLLCSRRAAKEMIRQGSEGGPYAIVLGLSQGSFIEDPPSAAYVTSKWAGRGLLRSMALDLARHDITVNGIGPGSVLTALHKYMNERFAEMKGITVEKATEKMGNIYPLKGYQTAEEMAAVYRFLFSDEARNITGTIIMDNGGHVML